MVEGCAQDCRLAHIHDFSHRRAWKLISCRFARKTSVQLNTKLGNISSICGVAKGSTGRGAVFARRDVYRCIRDAVDIQRE